MSASSGPNIQLELRLAEMARYFNSVRMKFCAFKSSGFVLEIKILPSS